MTRKSPRDHKNENYERDHAGVIATLRCKTSNESVALAVLGKQPEALLVIAAECDARGADWCVQSLSTPRTIMADLAGRGRSKSGHGQVPEHKLMSKIGRNDLVAPELYV